VWRTSHGSAAEGRRRPSTLRLRLPTNNRKAAPSLPLRNLSFCHRPSAVACLNPNPSTLYLRPWHDLRISMSSLHSCHWDWCRFTTVLHDNFVKHVVSTHLDKAEPVKRAEISLIHRVEQGASGHSGESVFILFVADAS
jgi:hypothetical protein